MDLDRLRATWQAQSQELDVEEALIVEKVLRESRMMDRRTFARDITECVVGLITAAFFVAAGHLLDRHLWPYYVAAGCCCFLGGFLIVDRRMRREPEPAATMARGLEQQLRKVNHQIALLKNVGWWYLLPCSVAAMLILGELSMPITRERIVNALPVAFLVAVLYIFIWWLNQWTVRKRFIPMKQALEDALRGLADEEQTLQVNGDDA